MFPAFVMDEETLLELAILSSDRQRREALEKKLKRARRIRHFAEQEYIAYKQQVDSGFNALLFLKRMRDIDDDFFLILLMVVTAARGASSQQQEPLSITHAPQNSNIPKSSRKTRPG